MTERDTRPDCSSLDYLNKPFPERDIIERLRDEREQRSRDVLRPCNPILAEAANTIERLTSREQELQKALAFWMPGVHLRFSEHLQNRAANDAYLLAGYGGEMEESWGDSILAREQVLVKALEDFVAAVDNFCVELSSPEIDLEDGTPPFQWHEEWLHRARAALNDRGET